MPRRFPVIGQLAHPRGVLAPATAFMLNIVNRPINRWATGSLELTGSEDVLDVGFGGGIGLELVSRRLTSGRLFGVDISEEMADRAARRFADDPRGGSALVLVGDVSKLPFADASFDRAYSVNAVFFWPDPVAGIAEIHRVMRPGGLAVIAGPTSAFLLARVAGIGPAAPSGPGSVRRIAQEAGFNDVRIRRAPGAALIPRQLSYGRFR
ncbi:MAG: class I SAM-dependent methyltransferase [Actinomycetota bacterium]